MHALSTVRDGMQLPVETRLWCDCILSQCDVGYGLQGGRCGYWGTRRLGTGGVPLWLSRYTGQA